jgi:hypothetical protein
MRRTLCLLRSIVLVGFYVALGVFGVVGLIGGQPLAWIAVGVSALGLVLRGFLVWARRRQKRLIAEEQARRAEPGYVAPVLTPRARQRRVLAISLVYIGPFVAVAIAAIIARPFLPSDLQTPSIVIALVMFVVAIVLALTLWKALTRVAPRG